MLVQDDAIQNDLREFTKSHGISSVNSLRPSDAYMRQ